MPKCPHPVWKGIAALSVGPSNSGKNLSRCRMPSRPSSGCSTDARIRACAPGPRRSETRRRGLKHRRSAGRWYRPPSAASADRKGLPWRPEHRCLTKDIPPTRRMKRRGWRAGGSFDPSSFGRRRGSNGRGGNLVSGGRRDGMRRIGMGHHRLGGTRIDGVDRFGLLARPFLAAA